MPNPDHIAQLMKGVAAWNALREENREIGPDLSEADLSGRNLSELLMDEPTEGFGAGPRRGVDRHTHQAALGKRALDRLR